MWSWLASFLSGPLLSKLVDAYKARLEADNNADKIAADLAGKDLELQAKEREINAKQTQMDEGRWWSAAPRAIVCWCMALYVAKIVLCDTILHFGMTYPLKGVMADAFSTVIVCWFGGRTIEKVARIWRPR
jgi:hypothetical protein